MDYFTYLMTATGCVVALLAISGLALAAWDVLIKAINDCQNLNN